MGFLDKALESIGWFTDPDPAGDTALACAGIKPRGKQIGIHAAFAVIMCRLQQDRRFACIHRRVMKIELCHERRVNERHGAVQGGEAEQEGGDP